MRNGRKSRMIYLDNAATSFIKPPRVYQAVRQAMLSASNPGRGTHKSAAKAAGIVYDCREAAANLFHMDDPSHVVFTMNATHALNLAIRSVVRPGMRVLISGFEHNAVTRPLNALGADIQIAGRNLFNTDDVIKDFKRKISIAEAVVCTHVSNVFGFELPLDDIASLCREHRVPLIIDASQSAGILDLNMPGFGAAFIAMPGHKALFGPQGTGLLLCGRPGTPLLYGGTGSDSMNRDMPDALPERLEAGTLNVPGIAGLLAGIEYVRDIGPDRIHAREQGMLRMLVDRLSDIPELTLFCDRNLCQSGILSFTVGDADSESFCEALSQKGIAVRGGLHCAPLAHRSAGTVDSGTVRISLSPFVAPEEIETACRIIRDMF